MNVPKDFSNSSLDGKVKGDLRFIRDWCPNLSNMDISYNSEIKLDN